MIQSEPTQTQESFTEAAKNINRTASISFPPDDRRRGEATYCNPVPGCNPHTLARAILLPTGMSANYGKLSPRLGLGPQSHKDSDPRVLAGLMLLTKAKVLHRWGEEMSMSAGQLHFW